RTTGTGQQVGRGQPRREVGLVLEDDHASVGVGPPRMRLCGDALAGFVIPFEPYGHSGIHPAATALLVVPRSKTLGFTGLYLHFRLYLAMLELRTKRVNGTNFCVRANK